MLRSPYVDDPFTWSCPAGRIEWNEEPEEAAVRELEEEAGYRGSIELVGKVEDPRLPFHHFVGIVPRQFRPRLNWENTDADWFALDDLPEPLHPGWFQVLPILQAVLG